MSELEKFISKPAITISPDVPVQQGASLMHKAGVGALCVLESGKLVGMLSERDVVYKVLAQNKNCDSVKVSEVMSTPVVTATRQATTRDALHLMHRGKFRHLPLLDEDEKVVGMISLRDLLKNQITELNRENRSLAAMIAADGPGG